MTSTAATKVFKVSVIVPIYNVAKYVRECVESLLRQTHDNIEILLVDDGSTDESGKICDELCKVDRRIIVFHKENGGLSDARNYGLSKASGDYVSFVDGDDLVSRVFIQSLLGAAVGTGCEIAAVGDGVEFRDGESPLLAESIENVPKPVVLSSQQVERMMLYQQVATGAPWRIYSRKVLETEPFPVGLYYEDLASTYKFIYRAGKVAFLDYDKLYGYRIRANSITRERFSPIKAESALAVSSQLYSDISKMYPGLEAAAASRCFSVCRMVFAQLATDRLLDSESDEYKESLWCELSKYRLVVLKDRDARKRERLAAFCACLGETVFTHFCVLCRKFGKMQ